MQRRRPALCPFIPSAAHEKTMCLQKNKGKVSAGVCADQAYKRTHLLARTRTFQIWSTHKHTWHHIAGISENSQRTHIHMSTLDTYFNTLLSTTAVLFLLSPLRATLIPPFQKKFCPMNACLPYHACLSNSDSVSRSGLAQSPLTHTQTHTHGEPMTRPPLGKSTISPTDKPQDFFEILWG